MIFLVSVSKTGLNDAEGLLPDGYRYIDRQDYDDMTR